MAWGEEQKGKDLISALGHGIGHGPAPEGQKQPLLTPPPSCYGVKTRKMLKAVWRQDGHMVQPWRALGLSHGLTTMSSFSRIHAILHSAFSWALPLAQWPAWSILTEAACSIPKDPVSAPSGQDFCLLGLLHHVCTRMRLAQLRKANFYSLTDLLP